MIMECALALNQPIFSIADIFRLVTSGIVCGSLVTIALGVYRQRELQTELLHRLPDIAAMPARAVVAAAAVDGRQQR